MLLMLSVHPSRRSDLLSDDRIEFSPKVRARDFKDAFGNICSRLVAPTGLLEVRNEFTIADSGEPDISARPTPRSCPLMPYRTTHSYICSAADIATPKSCRILRWSMFGRVEGGWARAQAICQYVHDRIEFGYHHARDDPTASEGHEDRIGVCPDFAHLAIAFCRCMNIPARYCTGYLGDIGVPPDPAPMDARDLPLASQVHSVANALNAV
jgi:transglutaminase-like putative cysteine protease